MIDQAKLFKKLEAYKAELTWQQDKRGVDEWKSELIGKIARSEIAKMGDIKELLLQLKSKVLKCDFVLKNDRTLNTEEREQMFIRRDEQKWLISFFTSSEEEVDGALDKVERELKNLK